MLKLYIGNKNYSSWSMRPWVLLKQAGIDAIAAQVRARVARQLSAAAGRLVR